MSTPSHLSFDEELLARFARKNPLAAGMRLVLEQLFSAAEIDALFEQTRDLQYTRKITFSTVLDVMMAVVTGRNASVHAALKKRKATLGASFTALYDKLNGAEPHVAAALVLHVATKAHALLAQMGGLRTELLPGWRIRILDGNHLAATERRMAALWRVAAGPLPGFCLVAFDPAAMLMTHVIPCEDGHAQERSLTAEILRLSAARDCWIADRNFCTLPILFGLAKGDAAFVIRQHGNLVGTAVGVRRECGRIEGGTVLEQSLRLEHDEKERVVRRVTIQLDTPTRDGDTEVHILTILPAEVSASSIAELYLRRWTLESAFGDLARWLNAEIKPLGYPRAALLGFCVGLAAYNAISTVLGALRAVHGDKVVTEEISGYYIAEFGRDAVGAIDDMIEPATWTRWRNLTLIAAALELRTLAARMDLAPLRKAKRGPKTPVPKRTRFKNQPHVSTKKLIDRTARTDS